MKKDYSLPIVLCRAYTEGDQRHCVNRVPDGEICCKYEAIFDDTFFECCYEERSHGQG